MDSKYSSNKENVYSSKPSSPTSVATSFDRRVLSSIGNSNDGYSGHRSFGEYNTNSSKKQRQY